MAPIANTSSLSSEMVNAVVTAKAAKKTNPKITFKFFFIVPIFCKNKKRETSNDFPLR
jgi:hypothetical protein